MKPLRYVEGMELYNKLVHDGIITEEPPWMNNMPTWTHCDCEVCKKKENIK